MFGCREAFIDETAEHQITYDTYIRNVKNTTKNIYINSKRSKSNYETIAQIFFFADSREPCTHMVFVNEHDRKISIHT